LLSQGEDAFLGTARKEVELGTSVEEAAGESEGYRKCCVGEAREEKKLPFSWKHRISQVRRSSPTPDPTQDNQKVKPYIASSLAVAPNIPALPCHQWRLF